jgi:rSAM/selenodomain-associated transferase 1
MPTQTQTDHDYQRMLLFVRAPQEGLVKTRLATRLGAHKTLALYRCFVEDILTRISGSYPTSVFYTPKDQEANVQTWLGSYADCQPQRGADLGQRMQAAFKQIFGKPVKRAVLIGSDFPDLDIEIIHEAFAALHENDVVIGPATDGGYYLIGFQKDALNRNLFKDIDWGTSLVFQQTLVQIEQANLSYHTLPSWQDIDTYEDLMAFYNRNTPIQSQRLKSMSLLNRILQDK